MTQPTEEENFMRIIQLVAREAPKAVRIKFDLYFPPASLSGILKSNSFAIQSLYSQRRITAQQMSILFPATGNVSSEHFDITLMICILRNLSTVSPPINGFDNLPSCNEINDGADLARIKFYRNEIAHNNTGKISSSDFNQIWMDLSEAIIRLGGSAFRDKCNDIKSSTSDVVFHFQEELKRTREELTEQLFTSIGRIDTSVECMQKNFNDLEQGMHTKQMVADNQLKKCSCFDSHQLQIEDWRNENINYVMIDVVDVLLKHLKDQYGFTVTGVPGIGKSALLHHIALLLHDRDGYTIVPCQHPFDIISHFRTELRQVFVIDDVCGRYSLIQHNVDNWISHIKNIHLILGQEKSKLLASCRLQIYLDEQFQRLDLFTRYNYNLSSSDLPVAKRKQIASKFLSEKRIKKIEKFLGTHEFLPLFCRLGKYKNSSKDVINLFKNPYEHYKKELEQMYKESDKSKYYSLFLFVMCGGYINEAILRDIEFFESVFLQLGTEYIYAERMKQQLDSLLHTYLQKKRNGTYISVHNRLFDFLYFFFGQKHTEAMIRFSYSHLIVEKII